MDDQINIFQKLPSQANNHQEVEIDVIEQYCTFNKLMTSQSNSNQEASCRNGSQVNIMRSQSFHQ